LKQFDFNPVIIRHLNEHHFRLVFFKSRI
jgi:hypothetical protein